MWGATWVKDVVVLVITFQSTLPVWGATCFFDSIVFVRHFNPRSPCGERLVDVAYFCNKCIFQSTLPVWGATFCPSGLLPWFGISIHAPRVGSDTIDNCYFDGLTISIHAPRVGSDREHREFLAACSISIHAPRVGSDSRLSSSGVAASDFNPRSPCGERRMAR